MTKKILLLGASLESDNRGVNALGVGAITILKNSYPNSEISLLLVGEKIHKQKKVFISGEQISINLYYFPKYDFLKSLLESLLIKSFNFRRRLQISNVINESDLFFDINEGDSFSDIYGRRRIIRHFFDSKLILSWGKELIFLPQTIGPFNSGIGKFLGKHILKRLRKLYVRDSKAIDFLKQIKVDYELAIDMAVYMEPKEVDINIAPGTIGLNINGLMYFDRYGTMAGKYDYYKEFLYKLVLELQNRDYHILLVPHTYNWTNPNVEDDLEAIKAFLKEHPDLKEQTDYLNKDYSAQEIKFVLSKLDFFMGSRMHSCIGALSRSIPTIGLAYSYKFEGTFKMFELDQNVINLTSLSFEKIDQVIQEIFSKIEAKRQTKSSLEKLNMRELPKYNF